MPSRPAPLSRPDRTVRWLIGLRLLLPLLLGVGSREAKAGLTPDFALPRGVVTGRFVLPESRRVTLTLLPTTTGGDAGTKVVLHLPRFFTAADGTQLKVGFSKVNGTPVVADLPSQIQVDALAAGGRLEVELITDPPPGPGVYEGAVWIREGITAWAAHSLALRVPAKPKPSKNWAASLSVYSSGPVMLTTYRPPWWRCQTSPEDGTFTVQLAARANGVAAEGIVARLERADSPGGGSLDIDRFSWTWNDAPIGNLTVRTPPPSDGRPAPRLEPRLEPQQVVRLGGRLANVAPGEYGVTIRFQAMNAAPLGSTGGSSGANQLASVATDEDATRLQLRILVRHYWALAALTLFLAVAATWLLTTGLGLIRQRLAILQAVAEYRATLGKATDPFPGVIRAQALLAQVRAVCRSVDFLMADQDFFATRFKHRCYRPRKSNWRGMPTRQLISGYRKLL